MAADPDRAWRPRELANALGIHNTKSFGTQILTWLTEGFLRKIRRGTYALADAWRPRSEDLTARSSFNYAALGQGPPDQNQGPRHGKSDHPRFHCCNQDVSQRRTVSDAASGWRHLLRFAATWIRLQ